MTKTGKRRFRIFWGVIVSTLVVLAGLELIVRFAARAGVVSIRTFQVTNRPADIKFVGDIDPVVGAWHVPNASVTVKTPRGKITYETNDHGMRDRPRNKKSAAEERVAVLGDSFIEGTFVEEADRVTDVLEARTGVEFLNFATSGGFGSIQEWLLYKHRVLEFDHSRVFIFLLPDNDFSDNDEAKHPPPDRYRPYLRKVGETYEITYPMPFEQANSNLRKLTPGRIFRHRMYNNWYTLNVLAQVRFRQTADTIKDWTAGASYDDFTEEDLDRLLYTYRQISDLASPRPVTVFVIPRERDFTAHEAGRFEGRIVKALKDFAGTRDGFAVVDLMPTFLSHMKEHKVSCKDFFLGFDSHWSPLGHRVAADAVLASLREGPDGARWTEPPSRTAK